MIKHEGGKWSVYSADGAERLGGPYDTEDEAKKRLAQVESAKHAKYDAPERTVRYDRATLRPVRRTDSGRMRLDGVFTRAGIFEYRNANGTPRRELRPPEEVHAPAALASLEMLPVVEDHPRTGLLGSSSARAQGWTLEGVRRDGDLVVGSLMVTDPALVKAVEEGKRALSVGYEVEYDPTPGTHPVYGRYDGIQRGIRGDHLAIVDVGRAGPEARVRMDSAGTFLASPATGVPSDLTRADTSVTMTEKDEEFLMDETKKLQEALAAATARAEAAEKSLREVSARADAAEGKVATLEVDLTAARETAKTAAEIPTLKAQLELMTKDRDAAVKARTDAEDPKRFHVAVQARAHLEQNARVILGDKFRADMADRDIMLAALEKVQGPITDKDQRSDDYIRARFDAAVESFVAGEKALRKRAEDVVVAAQVTRVDARSAREKMIEENRTLRQFGGDQ